MPPALVIQSSICVETRRRTAIKNVLDVEAPIPGVLQQSELFRRKYIAAKHRPTEPSKAYNCHGLTFASRRTTIYDSADLRKILVDDGYASVERTELSPGDIVLYIGADGDIEHSGIVIEILQIGFRVLSKWGVCHEVVHMYSDCPYNATNLEFYRMLR